MKYEFLNFQLDTDKHEFRVDGELRTLEPQVFDLLTALVESRDRLMSRDELVERVWSGRIVSDATIDARVNAARKAVGDDGAKQSVIKTIPRRGFRFVAQLTVDGAQTRGQAIEARAPESNGGVGDVEIGTAPAMADKASFANEAPTLELPDRPSIAVLPFENMSGDPDQEYFSDGITEDIIIELSRYRELFVIARNSTFAYKGKAVDLRQLAVVLGVQHVLEGGVRRSGDRVRITAQLVEAATGHQLWAERYDRELDDIFAVQDEVTRMIVGALGASLRQTDIDRAERKEPENLDAYDRVLRATAAYLRMTKADIAEARRLCLSAIELDPGYARAYARLALTYTQDRFSGWVDDPTEWLKRAHEAARKAVSLDEGDYDGHLSLGICNMGMGRHDQAVTELQRAVELNPNYADSFVQLGNVLTYAGRADEAISEIKTAMRLNPHYPPFYLMILGRAHFVCRQYEQAVPRLERAVNASPGLTQARAVLAASYTALGREDEAEAEIEEILKANPNFTVDYVTKVISYKNPEDLDHHLDLLRKAGLPD